MLKASLMSIFLTLLTGHIVHSDNDEHFASKRRNMVEKQIKARGIVNEGVLKAMRKVKRHLFVPRSYRHFSYEDYPLPIGQDQTISQPFIVAYMSSLLDLKGDEKVLEIGTGSGYQAAILGEIVSEVYTIEIIKELAVSAQEILKRLNYTNISVMHGDGYKGWPEHAPYDAIIVTAAPLDVPERLIEQLRVGGRMIVPVGPASDQKLYLITKSENVYDKEEVLPVRFVPMVQGKEQE